MADIRFSTVYLCRSPIDLSYKNQLTFTNKDSQINYFKSIVGKTYSNVSYVRKDSYIHVPDTVDDIRQYNYVVYQNSSIGEKWYYAFITNIDYATQLGSRIYITTDVWQTWQFDITILQSWVEREHVNDDSYGLNQVPENMETGEYTVSNSYEINYSDEMRIAVALTIEPDGTPVRGNIIHDVFTGLGYKYYTADNAGVNAINSLIAQLNVAGKGDSIVGIFMYPATLRLNNTYNYNYQTQPNNINGYVPKNNKTLISPHTIIVATNNSGNSAQYYPEFFNGYTNVFATKSAFSMQGSIILYPTNYKGKSNYFDEGVIYNSFPQCTWTTNVFANWYAQTKNVRNTERKYNAIDAKTKAFFSASKIGVGVNGSIGIGDPKGVADAIIDYSRFIESDLSIIRDHYVVPPTINGQLHVDSANITWKRIGFTIYTMQITAKMAKRIDDFFTMYGYKIQELKIPNIKGRPYFNYVKTNGVNIKSSIPFDDINIMKNMFDNGVTFWHDPEKVGDYSVNNGGGGGGSGENPSNPDPDPGHDPEPIYPNLIWPIINGENSVTSSFGWRDNPTGPGQDFHEGIDIASPQDTPIRAAADGVVTNVVNSSSGYGNNFFINHGNGFYTHYAHCNAIGVSSGTNVTQNDIIATVGDTGNTTGYHLHFGVRIDGVFVDPITYLP